MARLVAIAVSLATAMLSTAVDARAPVKPSVIPASTTIKTASSHSGPPAATRFCDDNPTECREVTGPDRAILDLDRWRELNTVNHRVNRAIRSQPDIGPDVWSLGARIGDCDDYAVQKRHDLIAKGWPARAIRLAVVRVARQHHLIVLVRTDHGDFALDSLTDRVKPWSATGHRFVMLSDGDNLRRWSLVVDEPAIILAQVGDAPINTAAPAIQPSTRDTSPLPATPAILRGVLLAFD